MEKENKTPEDPFVYPSNELYQDGYIYQQFHGITLRDYFAAKAMQGLAKTFSDEREFGELCKRSYGIADALLIARESKK